MKHLRLFETVSDLESTELILPNVSLVRESKSLTYKPDKPEIIEYHFDIPLESFSPGLGGAFGGFVEDDFSDIFNKLHTFALKYGYKPDYAIENNLNIYFVEEDVWKNKVNIIVNSKYKTTGMEYYVDEQLMGLWTDAPDAMGGGSNIDLRPQRVWFECGEL